MTSVRRRPPVVVVGMAVVGVAFFALPLVGLLQQVRWGSLANDLSDREAIDALRLSLVCSLGAAGLSITFGLPLAWMLARVALPARSLVRGLVLVPMVLPPVVGGVALLSAFSRTGILGSRLYDWFGLQLTFSTWGAMLAETFVSLPFFVITVEAALRTVDVRYEDVASTLGASGSITFRRVTFPAIRSAVVAGAILAWARALGEFGATITFAGNVGGRTRTLPLAVYLALEGDPARALALSLVLLVVSLAVIVSLRDRLLGRT